MPTSRLVEGLRGKRYGEVFLAHDASPVRVEVYNTFALNDCPDELWRQLDPVMIARQFGASLAILNGPRFWMIDAVAKLDVGEGETRDFGGILMRRVATLELDGPPVPHFYREQRVTRSATIIFDAGRAVYELLSDDARRYVMQAYCVKVDDTITEASLASLGERLHLPGGWVFQSRILENDLIVGTTVEPATVLQDELQNTYSLVS